MLPQALPRARIMRFGYNSQWFGENAIKQRLSTVAEALLRALRAERKVLGIYIDGNVNRKLKKLGMP